NPYTGRRGGRNRRGNSSEATGKFSVRARRATSATSMHERLHTAAAGGLMARRERAAMTPQQARVQLQGNGRAVGRGGRAAQGSSAGRRGRRAGVGRQARRRIGSLQRLTGA